MGEMTYAATNAIWFSKAHTSGHGNDGDVLVCLGVDGGGRRLF